MIHRDLKFNILANVGVFTTLSNVDKFGKPLWRHLDAL
jgi:hypothetical protein